MGPDNICVEKKNFETKNLATKNIVTKNLLGLIQILDQRNLGPGRQIPWEPGNQVPMKCLSSSEFVGRIHAFSQIGKISLTEGYELTRNNSCDKN